MREHDGTDRVRLEWPNGRANPIGHAGYPGLAPYRLHCGCALLTHGSPVRDAADELLSRLGYQVVTPWKRSGGQWGAEVEKAG